MKVHEALVQGQDSLCRGSSNVVDLQHTAAFLQLCQIAEIAKEADEETAVGMDVRCQVDEVAGNGVCAWQHGYCTLTIDSSQVLLNLLRSRSA